MADARAPENPRLGPLPVGRVHGTIKLPRTRSLTVVLGTVHTIVSGVKSFCFSTLTSRTTRSPRRGESLTIMSADPRQRATPQCHAASSCCGAGKLEERHSLQLADRLGIPSPKMGATQPYWQDSLMRKVIWPAAKRAGITKRIG